MRILPWIGIMAACLLAACASPPPDDHIVSFATDPRDDAQLMGLLPGSALAQNEFPWKYMAGMMRACLRDYRNISNGSDAFSMDHADDYCACKVDKDVHRFTMVEWVEAGEDQWNKKKVPDAVHKRNVIKAECMTANLN